MDPIRDRLLAALLALALPAAAGAAPAARQGDVGQHAGSAVAEGASTVWINGQPAARAGDVTTCPQTCIRPSPPFVVPHVSGLVTSGSGSVQIEGAPAARLADTIQEPPITPYPECQPIHPISSGSADVQIGP